MLLGTEVALGPGEIVLDGDPAPPTERSTADPTFRPMSIVAKGSPISVTAELLLHTSRQKFSVLYNGRVFPQNCPFPWVTWTQSNS